LLSALPEQTGVAFIVVSHLAPHHESMLSQLLARQTHIESMRLLLEMSGHEVYVVNDGASAIEAARRLAPDLALIDIGLPGLSGHDVAKQIRRDRNGDKILLAVLTGYGTDEDRKQSRGPQPVIQVWIGNCWLADFDGRTSDGADGDQQSKTHSPKYLVGTQQ
jgi:CheY-like chemotaxis protein